MFKFYKEHLHPLSYAPSLRHMLMWEIQSSCYVMGWQFSFNGPLNWITAEANWRLLMEPSAAMNYEIVEAACFVQEHRGGRPGEWANDIHTGKSWAGVRMIARDQQDAAEEEREDTDGEFNDLPDQHVQTPDDPLDVSDDESACLDLNDSAAELNVVLENHDEDDDPDDDDTAWSPFGSPPPGGPPAYRAGEANAMAEEESDDESTAAQGPVRPRSR